MGSGGFYKKNKKLGAKLIRLLPFFTFKFIN